MYALLLAFRYLRTRMIPLVAIGAVGLCVALVVVVVGVMSGFMHQIEKAGKSQIGDVVVANGLRGLPDPEGFIAELKQNDAIAAATPLVETFATIRMPYDEVRGVQVWASILILLMRSPDLSRPCIGPRKAREPIGASKIFGVTFRPNC